MTTDMASTISTITQDDQDLEELTSIHQEMTNVSQSELGRKPETESKSPEEEAAENEKRRKSFTDRAKRQRELGKVELTKNYPGAMVVSVSLKVNNLTLASMVDRFIGLIDKGIFQVKKFHYVIDEAAHILLVSRIQGEINQFVEFAQIELKKSELLLKNEKEKHLENSMNEDVPTMEWITPSYPKPTTNAVMNVKDTETLRIIRAIENMDKAILNGSTLVWNGSIDQSEIDSLSRESKKKFMAIFSATNKGVAGIFKKATTDSEKRSKKSVNSETE